MNGDLNLTSLKLQNFATFTNQNIDFTNEFNTIVGETGSGKSLILDALQMSFGQRADKKLVRKDSEFASIETTFSCNDNAAMSFFDEIGYPFVDEIVIKRIIYASGKSKSYLNFQSCPLNVLTRVARKFIDLVGQFENQKLLSEDYQLKLLDNYAQNEELYKSYNSKFSKLKVLESKLIQLNEDKARSLERKDFLLFQINELSSLNPSIEQEAELKKKKDLILNFEENKKVYEATNHLISENESSILNQLSHIQKQLSSISQDSLVDRLANIQAELEDISFEVSKSSQDEGPSEDIEEIINTLDSYQKLKRKFNTDTRGLSATLEKYQQEYSQIQVIDNEINSIHQNILDFSSDCHNLAKQLHSLRLKKATELSNSLTELVRKLKMNGAIIDIRVTKRETLCASGISDLEFYAQTNTGEGFHPIRDIASGGELSRILLALRQILSQSGSISVFLFDEIDTGIGGETALSIGQALQEVSKSSQVIAITHLAQIANYSSQIISVKKETVNQRTISTVEHYTSKNKESIIKEMQAL